MCGRHESHTHAPPAPLLLSQAITRTIALLLLEDEEAPLPLPTKVGEVRWGITAALILAAALPMIVWRFDLLNRSLGISASSTRCRHVGASHAFLSEVRGAEAACFPERGERGAEAGCQRPAAGSLAFYSPNVTPAGPARAGTV